MKYILCLVLFLFMGQCNAAHVVRDIDFKAQQYICSDFVKENDTLIIFSDGGELKAATEIGYCIKHKHLKLQVMKALSAAPYMVFFSDNVCLFWAPEIGTHTPYRDINNVTLQETRLTLMYLIQNMVGVAKISLPVALEFSAYMFLTPSRQITEIRRYDYIRMLGDKYKGFC